MSLLGAVALVLAAVGVYGVVSYTITLRTREIAIRMALGADRTVVYQLVGKDVMVMLAYGVAAGAVTSVACSRFMGHLLYGIDGSNPVTASAAVAVLTTIIATRSFRSGQARCRSCHRGGSAGAVIGSDALQG